MLYLPHLRFFACLLLTLLILLFAGCSSVPLEVTPGKPTARVTATEPPPVHNQIQRQILLPAGAKAVAFGDGSIWVTDSVEQNIIRIDMVSGKIAGPAIALDFEPQKIAFGEGAVWVFAADHSRIVRIDPQTNEVVAEIDLSALQIPSYNLVTLSAGEGAVWITDQRNVIQIGPKTNQIVGKPLPAGEEVVVSAVGHGTLWTGSHDDGIIARFDAESHRVVATIEVGFSVHGLAVSKDMAWVLDEHGFGVVRIDPYSNQLQERFGIDFVGSNLAAGAGSVWVAPAARDSGRATGNDGIARIDETQKQIVETIHVGSVPASEYYAVYFSEGFVWVLVNTQPASIVQIAP